MKLTNSHREKIVTNSLKKKRDELKKIEQKNPKMFKKAYNALFNEGLRKKVNSLPNGWVDIGYSMSVNIDGNRVYLDNSYGLDWEKRDETLVPLPNNQPYVLTGQAAIEIMDWYKSIEAKKEEIKDAQRKLNCLLYHVTTDTKLQSVWPEGKEFYVDVIKEEVISNVPSIQTAEVNRAIGLSVKG